MASRRPPRLHPSLYLGCQRYFLTICCEKRQPLLDDPAAREIVLRHLRTISLEERFAIIVYYMMPDHLHVVAEGERDGSELLEFMRRFKQKTAFDWKARSRKRLWQKSFHDHVLRDNEPTKGIVRYVLENPVRAKLVEAPADYPYSGSFVYRRDQLTEWAFGWHKGDDSGLAAS
jgi:putative transposase